MAAPGNVAEDGDGKNSPYTEQLIKAMNQKGRPLEMVFKYVAKGVMKQTRKKQVPWTSSSVTGDFFFIKGNAVQPIDSHENEQNKYQNIKQHEERFWASVEKRDAQASDGCLVR